MTRALYCVLDSDTAFGASSILPLPHSVHRSKMMSRGCASDMASFSSDEGLSLPPIF